MFNKCTVLEKLLRHDQFIKLIFTLVTWKHLGVFCGCIQVIADKTHKFNYSDIENSVHTCLIETFSRIDFPFCWCFLLQAPDKVYCCTTSDPAMVLMKTKQCVQKTLISMFALLRPLNPAIYCRENLHLKLCNLCVSSIFFFNYKRAPSRGGN